MDLERTPPRKIIKLSSPDEEQKPPIIETSPSSMISQKEMQSLVLQHKRAKEMNFRENYMRQLLELYFLKSGGNILDFETWRKKVKSSHCLHFLQQNSLEPENAVILDFKTLENSSRLLTTNTKHAVVESSVVTLTPITHNNHTYVKIQSPVLNQSVDNKQPESSSTLPTSLSVPSELITSESIKQSSQRQPSISVVKEPLLLPQEIKSEPTNINVELLPINTILTTSSSPTLSPNSSQSIIDSSSVSATNQEQIVEKAKHEASVMQRISELQKKGLWSEKRLPKLQEPPRNKVHWDYLMEEMVWLSADFAQERKWKKAAAKKCARMIQKHFQDKAMAIHKAEKAHEQHLKRISSFIAKIVRNFWSDVERMVEYKTQLRLEEKRKQAFDQHLNLIVTQTEKYSKLLVEGMNKSGVTDTSVAISTTDALSDTSGLVDDDEFNVNDIESSEDDEESIARAERMQAEDDERAEIEALRKQSQMETDDFLNDLPEGYLENRLINDHLLLVNKQDDDGGVGSDIDDALSSSTNENTDPNFDESGQDSEDVEETILEQEQLENNDKYNVEDELHALKADVDLPIDELIAKYSSNSSEVLSRNQLSDEMSTSEAIENEDIDDDDDDDDDIGSVDEENDDEMDVDDYNEEIVNKVEDDISLKSLIHNNDSENRKKDLMDNVAAIAESIQPKGNTLSSQEVVTKVPFLLKHSLREYQHIGLDWLVTMYEKNFNGILADEMGLGKTIQTIALLAHLACEKEIWGQHLVVVPTSVMLNWEMEFKKWCPAFKILTYYGSIKERRQKRQGWTKPNMFHVCITSYKLVIQDYKSFRGKKWHYFILDEAQNIKNFKSQRWQLLLNFNTKQRLLLTGTPLQNNLMELWSLMHFLMPNVFQSHREFKEWFSIPVTGMIEGNTEVDENTIKRLHKVLRPFLLRRLKSEVEKQMPKKYEQVVVCRLSKRQRYLYDDFMSRAKTKETLATGNLLSVINILMQLRKVCNHPNLFEDRPTISPFRMFGIVFYVASLITTIFEYDWTKEVNKSYLNLKMIEYESELSAYASYRFRKLSTPWHHIEKIDLFEPSPPLCPKNHIKIRLQRANPIRIRIHFNNKDLEQIQPVPVGTSPTITIPKQTSAPHPPPPLPLLKTQQLSHIPFKSNNSNSRPPPPPYPFPPQHQNASLVPTNVPKNNHQFHGSQQQLPPKAMMDTFGSSRLLLRNFVLENNFQYDMHSENVIKNECEVIRSCDRIVTELQIDVIQGPGLRPRQTRRVDCQKFQLSDKNKSNNLLEIIQNFYPMYIGSNISKITVNDEPIRIQENLFLSRPITTTLMDQLMYSDFSKSSKGLKLIKAATATTVTNKDNKLSTADKKLENVVLELRQQSLHRLFAINQRRCEASPMYGNDLVSCVLKNAGSPSIIDRNPWSNGRINCNNVYSKNSNTTELLKELVLTPEQLVTKLENILEKYVVYVPAVVAPPISFHSSHPSPSQFWTQKRLSTALCFDLSNRCRFLHKVASAMATQFPDTRLIQYDCGKLQMLDVLLKRLKSENHRVLIFTQMTRMLDILETFLNHHGHIYLRLDGSTKVEQRQILMEQFNTNRKIFVFILSTRSGGIGVNLTGADTVIFYDSDWNPTMDAQAQDRCHRIGQTRDVHIYRLISEKTVEENILRKANQKRLLGDIAIEGGNFTTEFFKVGSIHELFKIDDNSDQQQQQAVNNTNLVPSSNNDNGGALETSEKLTVGALESVLASCEDEMDVQAAKIAKEEAVAELDEFDESIPIEEQDKEPEISKVDLEVQNLMKQLTPIEKYMMDFIEAVDSEWAQKQLQLADKEIELQKQEWEANQKREQLEEEERIKLTAQYEDSEILTISRDEAVNKVRLRKSLQKKQTNSRRLSPKLKSSLTFRKNYPNGVNKKIESQKDSDSIDSDSNSFSLSFSSRSQSQSSDSVSSLELDNNSENSERGSEDDDSSSVKNVQNISRRKGQRISRKRRRRCLLIGQNRVHSNLKVQRNTRSRGNIDIDLWTLDKQSIIPKRRTRRKHDNRFHTKDRPRGRPRRNNRNVVDN